MHAVYFAGGRALSYQNHWLRAPRFLLERAAGTPLWPRVRLRFLRTTCLRCKHSMRFPYLLLALDRLEVLVLHRRMPVQSAFLLVFFFLLLWCLPMCASHLASAMRRSGLLQRPNAQQMYHWPQ